MHRRYGRLITLTALTAALAAPGDASAASTPALAGVNTITATRPAMLPVRLTKPAVLRDPQGPDDASADLYIGGGGRGFAGFVLRSADGRYVFAGGRLDGPRAGQTFITSMGEEPPLAGDYAWQLPAGRYHLYLLTTGGATWIQLRLLGLSGTARLTPTSPRTFAAVPVMPTLRAASSGASVVYSAGDATTMRKPGLSWSSLYHVHDAHVATSAWFCTYFAAPATPAPGCVPNPRGNSPDVQLGVHVISRSYYYWFYARQPLPEGYVAHNVWLTMPTPAVEVAFTQIWLTY